MVWYGMVWYGAPSQRGAYGAAAPKRPDEVLQQAGAAGERGLLD